MRGPNGERAFKSRTGWIWGMTADAASLELQGALFAPPVWRAIKDGDDGAREFFDRHYSRKRYADGRQPKLFVGPGEKLVLVTACRRGLFVWRKFISGDGQQGVNCAIFRNEGAGLSSWLIAEADAVADQRWPGERHFTYVDPRKTSGIIYMTPLPSHNASAICAGAAT